MVLKLFAGRPTEKRTLRIYTLGNNSSLEQLR